MAHALQRFIQKQMDDRRWKQKDLVRESKLTRAHVSKLVNDKREKLPQLVETETVNALAKAFGIPAERVMLIVLKAIGVDEIPEQEFVYSVNTASDDELIDELRDRMKRYALEKAGTGDGNPPDEKRTDGTPVADPNFSPSSTTETPQAVRGQSRRR